MSFSFVCCPKCGEVIHLKRIGPAGVIGVRDSRTILCEPCTHVFHSKGNTWKEEHGFLR